MVDWVIIGLVVLLVLLVVFKSKSFASMLSPGPSPAPGPAAGTPGPVAGPPPKYTQTKIINPGQDCNANGDSGWTKIGSVTCAK